jgi:uncharacterized protein YdhG (YjbR/CyaY superfamily)
MGKAVRTVDQYIQSFSKETATLLEQVRKTIMNAAPDATETINYGIPTYVYYGNLIHFGGYKTHIGLYPGPSGIEAFKDKLKGLKQAKGSVQFPLDKPMPLELIEQIVKFRLKENGNKKTSAQSAEVLK